MVSYAQQTHDSPNPLTRLAHRARYKISIELNDKLLPQEGAILDFGAGEGTFLSRLGALRPDAKLFAVEPYMQIAYPGIARVDTLDAMTDNSVDIVCALEALEHVTDKQLDDFLTGSHRTLRRGGVLVVTVPIMYGLALPIKEASRALLHRKLGDTGLFEMTKATLGMPIERASNRLYSHKGFDFRDLRRKIRTAFPDIQTSFSPFARAPWWVNSQAILLSKKS